jgi:hypothetical protein
MSISVLAQPLIYPTDLIFPPEDVDSFVAACAKYTLYFLPADYRFCISVSSPGAGAADNQNKVKFQLDSFGRPQGAFFFYNGSWRLLYSGLPFELRYFFGQPYSDFDSTGLGLVGTRWDGWAIANGQNGTQDLRNQFVLSGNYAQSAFGWYTVLVNPAPQTTAGVTTTVGATTGGAASTLLQVYNLPAINCSIPLTNSVIMGGSQFYALSVPSGSPNPGGTTGETFVNGVNTGVGQQPGISPVPPYIAVGLAMFIGYS